MLRPNDLYHLGIITEDFDGTVERMTRELDLRWSPIIAVEVPIWTRDHGERLMRPRAIYSRDEPCYEIVAAVEGTPLVPIEGRPLHHVGYWTDDLQRESDELAARGAPKIMCAQDERGRMFGMAYHMLADGVFVELVDRASFVDWKAFLAGEMQHEVLLPD